MRFLARRDGGGGESPFRLLRAVVAFAALYAAGAFVWLLLGDRVPGGRWFAVHLFTLGVLSNLVLALSHHFASTLLGVPGGVGQRARFLLLNGGAFGILAGFPVAPVLAAGATAVTAAVVWLVIDLRRMRRVSLQGRHVFVVRGYEWAAAAFLVGAILGLLMGLGVLGGAWYGAGRLAHLHANILGWGGLTLLATVVFFGPTIMGTPVRRGAELATARALPVAATGLAIAVAGLLLTGAGGGVAAAARVGAGLGLAAYAAAATVVCLHVLLAGRRAEGSPQAWLLQAACLWFPAVVWGAAVVVGTWNLRLLDGLGVALLVGVLGQAILASLGHLAPVVSEDTGDAREATRARLRLLPRARPVALNTGLILVVATAVLGPGGDLTTVLSRAGWVLVAAAALSHLWLVVGSFRASTPAA
jgi:hypothetical protein